MSLRVIATIAVNALQRLTRSRSNLFFLLALPMLLIVVLGSAVTSFVPTIAVVGPSDDPLADDVLAQLREADKVDAVWYVDTDDAIADLERERVNAVVVLPDGYTEALLAGEAVEVGFLSIPDTSGLENRAIIDAVLADQSGRVRAALLASERTGSPVSDTLAVATATAATIDGVSILTVDPDSEPFTETSGMGLVASQELVLFVFLTGMTASAALIQDRQLGVIRRTLSTPTTSVEVLLGLALGRFLIAVIQAGFLVVATSLIFGVDWGSWPATLAIITIFSLVATAIALVVGSLASNENQSTAVGLSVGLGAAAFGGSMVPLEIFPDGLRRAAHVTPHAWANDAFSTIIQEGGTLGDITTELGVLAAFATAMLALGMVLLNRAITR